MPVGDGTEGIPRGGGGGGTMASSSGSDGVTGGMGTEGGGGGPSSGDGIEGGIGGGTGGGGGLVSGALLVVPVAGWRKLFLFVVAGCCGFTFLLLGRRRIS